MDILYLLIPVAILLVIVMVAGFLWAARSGQFDDLEGPAHRILMEEEEPREPPPDRDPSGSQERSTPPGRAKRGQ